MTWRGSPPMITWSPLPPVSVVGTEASGSRLRGVWSSVSDLQIGAELHLARVRRERAGQQIDQRRLAGAVRTDDADAVAARRSGSRSRARSVRSP